MSERTQGGAWLEQRTVCAFCNQNLSDLGRFHSTAVAVRKNESSGFCSDCGSQHVPLSIGGAVEQHDGESFSFQQPAQRSPLSSCLYRALICENCGWWCTGEISDNDNSGYKISNIFGVLQKFEISQAITPVEILNAEIGQWIERLDHAHPNRMEDFVATCLKGVYDCEVRQIGYTRDGGIDLVLLKGEAPVAVQIKRRRSDKTESVAPIREFLGAALLNKYRNLIYATTAQKFSKEARFTAQRAVKMELVDTYELFDLDALRAIAPMAKENIWRYALGAMARRGYDFLEAPDPYLFSKSSG